MKNKDFFAKLNFKLIKKNLVLRVSERKTRQNDIKQRRCVNVKFAYVNHIRIITVIRYSRRKKEKVRSAKLSYQTR